MNFAESDAVFEARVLPGGSEAEVLRSWKGSLPRVVEFWVWSWNETQRLKPGEVWLAYTRRVPGRGYEALPCRGLPQRWAWGDIAWLEQQRQAVPPHNSVILRGWGFDAKLPVRLRGAHRVIPLRGVGSNFYYADNLPVGEYRIEVQGYDVAPGYKVTVGPGTMLKSHFLATGRAPRQRPSGE